MHPLTMLTRRSLLCAILFSPLGHAATPDGHTGAYRMFVGMDVEVPLNGELRPMRRVLHRNRDAEVVVEGAIHHVSINQSEVLRLKKGLKIGRIPVEVQEFDARRAYSYANDPYRRNVQVQMAVQSQADERSDLAQFQHTQATLGNTFSREKMSGATAAALEARMAAADASLMNHTNSAPVYNFGELRHRLTADMAKEEFDAIEATFLLSSAEPVADVHLVFVADYNLPDKKDELRRLVYVRAIGALSQEPRHERIWVQGLPTGYQLQESTVHLYTWGEELPTNFSEKPVDLTYDQAVQVLLAEHQMQHRNATRPAEPIWVTAPANFRARLDPTLLPAEAQLRIDENGRVIDLLDGDGQPLPLSGFARRVLTETRFYPALEKGTAVASTLRIELPQFLQ